LPGTRARAGVLGTPHGDIHTPAFIPVGTKATVKAILPEAMAALGAQAILANAYHLYLQPGADVIEAAGGLGAFMNWSGPTFTDSGGFQVMSLGVGFKKVLSMETATPPESFAQNRERLARVDDDGVTFKSHLDGSMHRFTPEVSVRVQQQIGADIIFAFDELTTLVHSRSYQERSVQRTYDWAIRCLAEHQRHQEARASGQQLFAVIQGAQHEDLRRRAARELQALPFDGFGIGGAIEKSDLGRIVGWVTAELPEEKPRHLLGIGEPNDLFAAIEQGIDTFDCVAPTRNARNTAVMTSRGRFNLSTSEHRRSFIPIDHECHCYTCQNYTRAYLHHAFKSKEMIAATLASIHNEAFVVGLVDRIRETLISGDYFAFRDEFLGAYYR